MENEVSVTVQLPQETESTTQGIIGELTKQTNCMDIWDQDSFNKGADLAKFIKATHAKIEKQRKELVEPFNEGVKRINNKFKALTDPLTNLLNEVKKKLLAFELAEDKRKREAAEKARIEAIKALPLEADANDLPPVIVEKTAPARGNFGTASATKRWTFKVTNFEEVPRVLLMIDEQKVKRAIADGVRDIPGLEIFQEKSMTIR